MMHQWGYPYGNGGFWFGGIFPLIATVLFWFLIIFLIVGIIRGFRGHHREWVDYEEGGSKALDILKERYAKGEINKKVFEEMKKDIS